MLSALDSVQGDGWLHFAAARREPMSWERFVELARNAHRYGNPRWGQLLLALSYYVPIHVVLTPLAILGVLFGSLTLVRGRWPRPSDPRELPLLLQVTAIALLTTPHLGEVWLYRPTCTNHVYPLAVQLAWAIPYRFLVERAPALTVPRSLLAALGMCVLGAIAGAGTEHAGPTLVVGGALCTFVALRRDRRVPLWAIAGLAGAIAGSIFLLTAPGQLVRYGGLAAREPLVESVVARGLGNAQLPLIFAGWLVPTLVLLAFVAGPRWFRRHPIRREAKVYFALAALALLTCLASPRQVARLLLAPSTLTAIGIGIIFVELREHARIDRRLRVACTAIVAASFSLMLYIQAVTWRECRARLHAIVSAPASSIVVVDRLTFSQPTPFSLGDDFRRELTRQTVAKLFGLARVDRD